MLKKSFGLVTLTVALALVVAVPSGAADKDPKAPSEKEVAEAKAQSEAIERIALAYQLADLGRLHNKGAAKEGFEVPELLIAAGSLLLRVQQETKGKFGDLDTKPTVEDDAGKPKEGATVATGKSPDLKDEADAFFAAARNMAGKDKKLAATLEAMIKQAEARDYRDPKGAIGGPKRVTRTIAPGETHVYTFTFQGNIPAGVGLQSNVPLRQGLVDKDTGHSLMSVVVATSTYTWVPKQTKPYIVRLSNGSKTPGQYVLYTN